MTLRHIAEATVAALERGNYAAPSGRVVDFSPLLKRCLEGTRCYKPEALATICDQVLASPRIADRTEFELVNETTLQGSARLVESGEYRRVGVLNFASAKHPGGGFLGGAKAQEESLARSSGLYPSLLRCSGYYSFHRRQKTGLYSDWMIFSPDCPVLRTDGGDWLEAPYVVSFIISAAPNAGAIQANQPYNLSKIPATFRERIRKLLALAVHEGCDALVLGAWGCGAFRNDPQVVAPLFWESLRPDGPFWGRFKKVLFSVLDPSKSQNIYNAFAKSLGETP
ncbi:MAG TPA: TIGR02452 family protein [Aggregatilineales bacterium]|nr:TIGR02452 family protein [Aggregatilineales bacterium]